MSGRALRSLVVARARNGVIGRDNALPWHLPADLAHFKRITQGHPVVMGRRTHESIGRPLPGRHNIVVTRTPGWKADGCTVVGSLEAAYAAAGNVPEVFVIGGSALYAAALPGADRIYLTEIDADVSGDTVFPEIDPAGWVETAMGELPADGRNAHALRFLRLDRRR